MPLPAGAEERRQTGADLSIAIIAGSVDRSRRRVTGIPGVRVSEATPLRIRYTDLRRVGRSENQGSRKTNRLPLLHKGRCGSLPCWRRRARSTAYCRVGRPRWPCQHRGGPLFRQARDAQGAWRRRWRGCESGAAFCRRLLGLFHRRPQGRRTAAQAPGRGRCQGHCDGRHRSTLKAGLASRLIYGSNRRASTMRRPRS